MKNKSEAKPNPEDALKKEQERFENMDYYERLGLQRNATKAEIIAAFRRLSVTYHPDKGGDNVIFQYMSEAYATLKNNEKRNQYDNSGTNARAGAHNRSQRAHEEAKRKEQERIRREEAERIKKEILRKQQIRAIVEEVTKGPYEYRHFIKNIQHLSDTEEPENFLELPEVFVVIKEQAINKAKHGVYLYDRFIKRWATEGNLKREIIDQDPDLMNEIRKIAEEKKRKNEAFYEQYKKEWADIGINI